MQKTIIDGDGNVTVLPLTAEEIAEREAQAPPPTPVPQEVTKAQGIAAMIAAGLWPSVKAYFETQATENERDLFNAITAFNRQSPLLLSLKGTFGLTDTDLDNLFIAAAQVVV